jgi:alkane 1-monooxygenase
MMDMAAATVHVPDSDHPDVGSRRWRDGKLLLWPLALVVPLLPLRAAALADRWGAVGWWSALVIIFGVFPIIDTVLWRDRRNVPETDEARVGAARYYRVLTYLYIPLQYASLVYACTIWASGDLRWFEALGLAVTTGIVAGIAINTAHELGHKRPALERWLSKVALAQSAYGHFHLEHNRGHHQKVSTPEDPASSRLGESFWEFLPRTVVGSLRSAVRLERERSERLGQRFWSPRNELLNAWVMSVVLFGGLVAVFGWSVAPWLAVQAVVGFCLLEVVNYIEHYGLLRQQRPDGRYERCRPEHSWNASNVVSNLLLYQLQRHSDHHAFPTRRYQVLRHFDDVPQLPTGYAGMIVLATIPPVWRRVMDHRVVDFYDGDVTRANIHPRVRERVLTRWAP